MPKHFIFYLFSLCFLFGACGQKTSKVELLHQEKAHQDSIAYANAQQNVRYSDSLLQMLSAQIDPLLQMFVYSKNEKMEDYGHYVHRLLETTTNTTRNFLQAYVSENRQVSIQSYYFGRQKQNQQALHVSVGENYIEKEGSNHAFNLEGWHEILTIEDDNAMQILAFIANHQDERVVVHSVGDKKIEYALTQAEKQALSETYELAVLMQNVDALERSIHVSNLQIQHYEKKQTNRK